MSFSGKVNEVKDRYEKQIQKSSVELLEFLKGTISKEANWIEEYVLQLNRQNDSIDREQLCKKIIFRRALKAGSVGTVCGLGGFSTMPLSLTSDMYLTFRIQARMVLAIAYIYGWNIKDDDTITDILLVMGGNAVINGLKNVGVKLSQEFSKKAVQKYITRDVMKKINKIISRKIITKAGEKSLISFAKLVPFVGGPVGGAFDYVGTQSIGRIALTFYSG